MLASHLLTIFLIHYLKLLKKKTQDKARSQACLANTLPLSYVPAQSTLLFFSCACICMFSCVFVCMWRSTADAESILHHSPPYS